MNPFDLPSEMLATLIIPLAAPSVASIQLSAGIQSTLSFNHHNHYHLFVELLSHSQTNSDLPHLYFEANLPTLYRRPADR